MKNAIILLFILMFLSCGMETFVLQNGFSKAPINLKYYREKVSFDSALTKIIDTEAVYEEYSDRYSTIQIHDDYINFLRFYSNGCFSIFYSSKNKLEKNMFNPNYSGYRGYFYKKNKEIKFDKFGEINQMKEFGKLSGTITVKGDTVYMYTKKYNDTQIFIKTKTPKELLNFNADW